MSQYVCYKKREKKFILRRNYILLFGWVGEISSGLYPLTDVSSANLRKEFLGSMSEI